MPQYTFQRTTDGKIEDAFFHMNDEKVYNGVDGTEVGLWKRVWSAPGAAVDSLPIDPYSAKDFIRITNKRGKVGDLFDRSAELSAKRADKDGIDHTKQAFYDRFSKKRQGKQHPQQRREEAAKKLEQFGVKVNSWGDE